MIKNSRLTLTESEERLRDIIESVPFPIGVYVGKEMKIILANKSIMDIWGKGDEVIGKSFSELLPELESQHIIEELDKVFLSGIAFHATNQPVDLLISGTERCYYFNYSFTPLRGADGLVYGIMNIAADVTDLNRALRSAESSERKYRQLITKAPIGICLVNANDLTFVTVNDAFINLTGHPKEYFKTGKFAQIFPELLINYGESLNEVVRTGIEFKLGEHQISVIRGDTIESRYVDFAFDPITSETGSVEQIMILCIDVTEVVLARTKMEEVIKVRTLALESANRNLIKSNAELEQFASAASHDLQEPLRKILTFGGRLKKSLGEVSAEAEMYLSKIQDAAGRMSVLIRQILAYAEIEADNKNCGYVDLNVVLRNVKLDFELLLEQKRATLDSTDLPTIQAVPAQMYQLFVNLISNALKFSAPEKMPEIKIYCSTLTIDEVSHYPTLDKQLNYYCICFADNGIGFDSSDNKQIFKLFHRLVTKQEYPGNGLGLALCQKIVENHYGHIEALSTPGNGARFNILLPGQQPNSLGIVE